MPPWGAVPQAAQARQWAGAPAVARTRASEPQKWSARRGPDPVGTGWAHRPAPETQVSTHQEQTSSLGCAIAEDSGWDGGGGWQGVAWDFMRTKESSHLTEHSPSWVHTRREHTSQRFKGPYAAVRTAALVAIAMTRQKPQWPSTDGGPKKMWHRCPMERSLGPREKRKGFPFVTSNDGPRDSWTW